MQQTLFILRPILYLCGILLTALSVAMLLPILIDYTVGRDNPASKQDITAFTISAIVTAYCGLLLIFTNKQKHLSLTIRQTFIFTTLIWLLMPTFSGLPLMFGSLKLSFTNAFFETMSGLTTTGATVIIGLDNAPKGLLLWRSLLHWMGGVGIIVMAVAILPMLQVGGMQLFSTESSDKSEKFMPRIKQIATSILIIYLLLTVCCATLYFVNGMSGFSAVNHAMATISTGGFSVHDSSMGYYNNFPAMSWIATVFMLMGASPFLIYLKLWKGNLKGFLDDEQLSLYVSIFVIIVLSLSLFRTVVELDNIVPFEDVLRQTAFNIASVMSGTGFATADYSNWHPMTTPIILFLMIIGGCAGSASAGIKMFRVRIMYGLGMAQIKRLLQPHGIFHPIYNGRKVPSGTVESILTYLMFYMISTIICATALSAYRFDILTSFSAAIAMISNVGPGLGEIIGPSVTYATLPDGAKWVLSIAMLLGRLEFFTILVMLAPTFWKR